MHISNAKGAWSKPVFASRMSITLSFSTGVELRGLYLNYFGDIRVGKLLEDLDAVAGMVACEHAAERISSTTDKVTLVTASVDRISLNSRLQPDHDLNITGFCTWTGNSSMEIRLEVDSMSAGNSLPFRNMEASFVFVAKNTTTGRSMHIPSLQLEKDADRALAIAGETAAKSQKMFQRNNLQNTPPSEEGNAVVHKIFPQNR